MKTNPTGFFFLLPYYRNLGPDIYILYIIGRSPMRPIRGSKQGGALRVRFVRYKGVAAAGSIGAVECGRSHGRLAPHCHHEAASPHAAVRELLGKEGTRGERERGRPSRLPLHELVKGQDQSMSDECEDGSVVRREERRGHERKREA